jgi:hypothetical protein
MIRYTSYTPLWVAFSLHRQLQLTTPLLVGLSIHLKLARTLLPPLRHNDPLLRQLLAI